MIHISHFLENMKTFDKIEKLRDLAIYNFLYVNHHISEYESHYLTIYDNESEYEITIRYSNYSAKHESDYYFDSTTDYKILKKELINILKKEFRLNKINTRLPKGYEIKEPSSFKGFAYIQEIPNPEQKWIYPNDDKIHYDYKAGMVKAKFNRGQWYKLINGKWEKV